MIDALNIKYFTILGKKKIRIVLFIPNKATVPLIRFICRNGIWSHFMISMDAKDGWLDSVQMPFAFSISWITIIIRTYIAKNNNRISFRGFNFLAERCNFPRRSVNIPCVVYHFITPWVFLYVLYHIVFQKSRKNRLFVCTHWKFVRTLFSTFIPQVIEHYFRVIHSFVFR